MVAQPLTFKVRGGCEGGGKGYLGSDDAAFTVATTQDQWLAQPVAIQGTLIGRSENAGPQGSGADVSGAMFTLTKTYVHAVAIQDVRAVEKAQNGRGWNDDGSAYTVDTHATQGVAVAQPITFGAQMSEPQTDVNIVQTLQAKNPMAVAFGGDVARSLTARHDSSPCADRGMDVVATAMQVRRLTPVECERLQGFPDGYTAIPWKKKSASECPDGPRYKALGNSMAVPCMVWIGERINEVSKL